MRLQIKVDGEVITNPSTILRLSIAFPDHLNLLSHAILLIKLTI